MSLRQSVCYPAFKSDGVSLDRFCAEAKAIGYEGIEIWGWDAELEDFAATVHEHGLVLTSMVGHDSISHGLSDPSQHDRIEHELCTTIDKAASLNVPGVICFSGERHPSRTDLEGLAAFIDGVRRVIRYAEAKGVNLNLEILNSRVDHPGYMADRLDWGLAACVAIDSPRFKLLFDIYHVQIMEGDIIRNLRRAMPYIGHIHTAGNPGRQEMDDTQELNYSAISKAIDEAGYHGFVGHELFSREPDKLVALRQAFEACSW